MLITPTYYIKLNRKHQENLAVLRGFLNLKVAFEDDFIWLTGFDEQQISGTSIKTIPYITVYYAKGGKLFLKNSQLPDCNEPSFLWTPILRAFPLETALFNHNYFGLNQKIDLKLISFDDDRKSDYMEVELDLLDDYIQTAPAIRLKKLSWVVVNDKVAIIKGTPLLPISGDVFWSTGDFIIPAGYNFDLHLLTKFLNKKINPNSNFFIVWNKNTSYYKIHKSEFIPLTISSFRKTTLLI